MTLVKNNIKLIFRCKALVLIVLCMLLAAGMLSVAFDSFMSDGYEIEEGTVGYSFSDNCRYKMSERYFTQFCGENNLDVIALAEGSAENAVSSGKVNYFAEFTDDGCTIYADKDHENQANVLKIMINSLLSSGVYEQSVDCIESKSIETEPIADSKLYYTIAYLVWGMWLEMVVLAVIVSSERKNKIGVRMRTTPVSSIQLYLGKFIPAFICISFLTAVEVILSTVLFDIEWQQYGVCILLGLFGSMAAAAVGTVIFTLVKNMIAAIVTGYGIVMFWGFVGGSFCPYYYAYYAGGIDKLSPVYHMTRAMVELNVSGSSDYTLSAIYFMLGITVLCVPIGMLSVKAVKER